MARNIPILNNWLYCLVATSISYLAMLTMKCLHVAYFVTVNCSLLKILRKTNDVFFDSSDGCIGGGSRRVRRRGCLQLT